MSVSNFVYNLLYSIRALIANNGKQVMPVQKYNTIGHVCPRTNRRAVAYIYDEEAAEAGFEPWRMVDGIDAHKNATHGDIWFASGSCKSDVVLDDVVLYVQQPKAEAS